MNAEKTDEPLFAGTPPHVTMTSSSSDDSDDDDETVWAAWLANKSDITAPPPPLIFPLPPSPLRLRMMLDNSVSSDSGLYVSGTSLSMPNFWQIDDDEDGQQQQQNPVRRRREK